MLYPCFTKEVFHLRLKKGPKKNVIIQNLVEILHKQRTSENIKFLLKIDKCTDSFVTNQMIKFDMFTYFHSRQIQAVPKVPDRSSTGLVTYCCR